VEGMPWSKGQVHGGQALTGEQEARSSSSTLRPFARPVQKRATAVSSSFSVVPGEEKGRKQLMQMMMPLMSLPGAGRQVQAASSPLPQAMDTTTTVPDLLKRARQPSQALSGSHSKVMLLCGNWAIVSREESPVVIGEAHIAPKVEDSWIKLKSTSYEKLPVAIEGGGGTQDILAVIGIGDGDKYSLSARKQAGDGSIRSVTWKHTKSLKKVCWVRSEDLNSHTSTLKRPRRVADDDACVAPMGDLAKRRKQMIAMSSPEVPFCPTADLAASSSNTTSSKRKVPSQENKENVTRNVPASAQTARQPMQAFGGRRADTVADSTARGVKQLAKNRKRIPDSPESVHPVSKLLGQQCR